MKKKFYQQSIPERLETLKERTGLTPEDLKGFNPNGGLSLETANGMIENVVGLYSLPLGIAQNFLINGREILVPMVIEEPSVVASASFMAKLAKASGGFEAGMRSQEMIGQLQVLDLADPHKAAAQVWKKRRFWRKLRLPPWPGQIGGGPRDIEVRVIEDSSARFWSCT